MYNNEYTSIENPIKRELTDQSSLSRKKHLCIYLIGFITGALLLLLILLSGNKKIGMNSMYNELMHSYVSTPASSSTPAIITASDTNVDFDDLTDGDTVKMHVFGGSELYSQVLRNPGGSNKIKTVPDTDADRVKWEVGYDASRDAYSFKNKGQNCYLKHKDNFLKCLSGLEDRSYWKADAPTGTLGATGWKYQQLKNYANNKCPTISENVNAIPMSKSNCNDNDSRVSIFRVV